jgi:hypothetical protein
MDSVSQSIRRNSGITGTFGGGGGVTGLEAAVGGAGAPWGGRDLEFIFLSHLPASYTFSPDQTPEAANLYKIVRLIEQ